MTLEFSAAAPVKRRPLKSMTPIFQFPVQLAISICQLDEIVDRTKNTCGKWQALPQVALHPTFHAFLSRKTVTCVACDVPMSHVTLMTLTLPLCQDFRPDLLSVEYKLNCSWGLSLHSAAVSLSTIGGRVCVDLRL